MGVINITSWNYVNRAHYLSLYFFAGHTNFVWVGIMSVSG
jgi:hypothetical protein